jgi:hypothetical protein
MKVNLIIALLGAIPGITSLPTIVVPTAEQVAEMESRGYKKCGWCLKFFLNDPNVEHPKHSFLDDDWQELREYHLKEIAKKKEGEGEEKDAAAA